MDASAVGTNTMLVRFHNCHTMFGLLFHNQLKLLINRDTQDKHNFLQFTRSASLSNVQYCNRTFASFAMTTKGIDALVRAALFIGAPVVLIADNNHSRNVHAIAAVARLESEHPCSRAQPTSSLLWTSRWQRAPSRLR